MRAGAQALSVLSIPLNDHVLTTLAEEPRALTDLRRLLGSPPQTTMRVHLRALSELGVLERHRHSGFPGSVHYELTRPGRDLMTVRETLEAWLEEAPGGPFPLGGQGAKSAVKALVDGWSTGIVRVLAARPVSLTELSALITNVSYPALERRLGAMRVAGLVEPRPNSGRGTPYRVTDWMRRAIAPLGVAARWERAHLPEQTSPIGRIDVESALLLIVPALRLPADVSGDCRLGVEMRNGSGEIRLAGVVARVNRGEVVGCVTRLDGNPSASISGSAASWLRAAIDGDQQGLEASGDRSLALGFLEGIQSGLRALASAPERNFRPASALP